MLYVPLYHYGVYFQHLLTQGEVIFKVRLQCSTPRQCGKRSEGRTTEIVRTTSDSPLCHISVGRWMKASGFPITSPERKDRCARVAASVAYHLVELLNDWKDGKYEATSTHQPVKEFGITAQMNCMDCHGGDIPTPPSAKL